MASAAYTLKQIASNQMKLCDFAKAPNSYLPIAELYRWLNITKETCPQLIEFIKTNCLADTYVRSEPCFKIALNSKNKPTLYLVEKALIWFLTNYQSALNQMGISNEQIQTVIDRFEPKKKTSNTYALHHLLTSLDGRNSKFKYHNLPRKEIEALLKETIPDQKGGSKPLLFFTTIANKMYLSVERENIPALITKWGKTFELSDWMIQKTTNTLALPDVTDEMIEINEFCKETISSDSFMHWFSNMAPKFFKEEFEGTHPTFIKAKTNSMQEVTCFHRNKIKEFIQKNKDILLMHGLNPVFAQKLLNEPTLPTESKKFPCLLISQLAQKLGKATAFIPKFKEFILKEALNDTFQLSLGNKKEIKAPVFLYYKSFMAEETLYIYEQAVPDFVNQHFQKLLELGISYQTLNSVLAEKKWNFSQKNELWTLKDFYQHSFSTLEEEKFNHVLSAYFNDTFCMIQKDGSVKKLKFFVQTGAKKNPVKLMTAGLFTLLNQTKHQLGLENLDTERLIALSCMDKIPEVIEIKNLCQALQISPKNENKVFLLFKNPNKRAFVQYFPDRSKKVIPLFGFNRDKTWGLKIGFYQGTLPLCLKILKKELIALGANPQKILELQQLTLPQKELWPVSKHSIYKDNPFFNPSSRQKE